MTVKRDLVRAAFRHIGLAAYAFDLTAEELQDAQSDLVFMMTHWSNEGLNVGFDFTSDSLDDESGAPEAVDAAIAWNLAVIIAPGYGKTPSPKIASLAKTSLDRLKAFAAKPPKMRSKSSLSGAGNRFSTFTLEDDVETPPDLTELERS